MGYNTDRPGRGGSTGTNWAKATRPVECQVKAEKGEGKFVVELLAGPEPIPGRYLTAGTGRMCAGSTQGRGESRNSRPSGHEVQRGGHV
jgi:hypothetical protein